MPRPLVEDDNPDIPEVPPQGPNPFQPIAERGESFWSLLRKFGSWLGSKHLSEPVRGGLKDFGREIWMSKSEYESYKRAQRRFNGEAPQRKEKWGAKPFKSFGPREGNEPFHSFGGKKRKRGRL